MSQLSSYLKLIRYPNLIIIMGTMMILKFTVFPPESIQKTLVYLIFVLLPVLTAASGYVINDIMDIKTDLINKPEKVFLRNGISRKAIHIFYITLLIFSILLSEILDYLTGLNMLLVVIISQFLLILYAFILKKTPLAGNFLVAFLSGIIPILVIYYEVNYINSSESHSSLNKSIIISYGFIAFYTSLIREVIKDLEDLKGDKTTQAYTLPVLFGKEFAHFIVYIIYILPLFAFVFMNEHMFRKTLIPFLTIFYASSLPFISTLIFSKNPLKYTQCSLFLKISMFTGIITFPAIYYLFQ